MKREVLGISGKMEQELGIYDLQSANNWLSKQKWPAYKGKYEFREKDGQFEFVQILLQKHEEDEPIELVMEQSSDLEVVVNSAERCLGFKPSGTWSSNIAFEISVAEE